MNQSIEIMKNSIVNILANNKPSIYIFGSIVLDDFRLGWSDIDILCFTEKVITSEQGEQLVHLRQELLEEHKGNLYFRSFEGAFITINAFINNIPDTVVYWGTSGQRITDRYYLDSFSLIELIEDGQLLYGNDIRDKLKYPTKEEIIKAVINHYESIRKYAILTERSIYSVGWILDVARCIYTLRTGKIIAKTKAGKWALDNNIAPDIDIIEKAINIRKEPNSYKNDNETMKWTTTLGVYIQRFADVLEKEIENTKLN